MEFLYQNGGTILITFILICIVTFNVKKLCKEKSSCGCGCKDCPSSSICHSNDK